MQKEFSQYAEREFLVSNGIGGYCSSSVCGANTRRYHGLLVASLNPPTQRMVLVSKLEETLTVEDTRYELSASQYPGAVNPTGFRFIEKTDGSGNTFTARYSGPDWCLEKMISMPTGKNTTVVQYENAGKKEIQLTVSPLLVYRDYHALFRENSEFDFFTERPDDTTLKIYAKYQAPPLYISANNGDWQLKNTWYKDVEYEREKERGFDYKEDMMKIGELNITLQPDEILQLVLSADEPVVADEDDLPFAIPAAGNSDLPVSFITDLARSGEKFLVTRKSTAGFTLLAGYHWFTDWGRDTMIALRGLTIATGKQEETKSILETFAAYIDNGMLPNRFPDYENDLPEYNTVDAALWLFIAVYDYHLAFGDKAFIAEVFDRLSDIIRWHENGTRYNIRVNEQGLLYAGEPGVQLTWMDAKVGDFVVTPRIGCPVEINILWYNALQIYRLLAKELEAENAFSVEELITSFENSFKKYFINRNGHLNDVVIPEVYTDESIRPNMIYAVSLPFSPLSEDQQKNILTVVEKELLTPYGLRTLNIADPGFKPLYEGDAWHRDTAYHQGTVWPFLWGEWALARLKMDQFSRESCKAVWDHSAQLRDHFYNEGCCHAIAEIYDGLNPLKGKGCVHQAWSVGNMLMVFLHPEFKLETPTP